MEKLRFNEQRSRLAITLIWIVLTLEILSIISDLLQYELLQMSLSGKDISMEAASANDLRQQMIALFYLVAYVISGITFIRWFRRAYYNLHLKLDYLESTEGWAAGAWFVPILNLYKPYQIMKELYVETTKLLRNAGERIEDFRDINLIVWWTLWIINSIAGQVALRLGTDTVDELLTSTTVNIISSIIAIPLALITIRVIKDYSKLEETLQEVDSRVADSESEAIVNK